MSVPGRDRPALTRRQRVLGSVALATLAASIWALSDDDGAIDRSAAPRRGASAAVVRLAAAGDNIDPGFTADLGQNGHIPPEVKCSGINYSINTAMLGRGYSIDYPV